MPHLLMTNRFPPSTVENQIMAKKKIKKPAKKSVKKTNPKAKKKKVSTKITHRTTITTTIETNLPSTGSYYIRARKKSWSLYLKTYKDGKPHSYEKIDPAVFYRFSINPSMSATEAKQRIKEFNKINKGSKIEVARQARALWIRVMCMSFLGRVEDE